MDRDATLVVDHVTKKFDDFIAVNDLSLAVRPGRIFGLIGPNGAGKTTTIRMIVNITAPDTGTIRLKGQIINEKLQDRIGYLPEERGLYKKMKIGDQLRFFGQLKGMSAGAADRAAGAWLAKLKLSDWKGKKADELSKGMQQKVQFAAAVMHDPELLILDEPFSGLDPISAENLKESVLELKAAGKTIIFSTHLMEQAEKMCDDICLLNRSRKVLDGSLREVKRGFSRPAIALRAEEFDRALLDDPRLVAGVKENSDDLEVTLAEGTDEQELLRRLVASGARVTRFEKIEPSLHDIFLAKAGETA
ncbi:MAG TPA: ATP-binding cassette domain-containing protein [Pyrinomonadaceae bacterium]|nr:ATP-binding cassette domain-containing protein [Pyrinomonadaceae bacterium]